MLNGPAHLRRAAAPDDGGLRQLATRDSHEPLEDTVAPAKTHNSHDLSASRRRCCSRTRSSHERGDPVIPRPGAKAGPARPRAKDPRFAKGAHLHAVDGLAL
jgi:hypothetical protein